MRVHSILGAMLGLLVGFSTTTLQAGETLYFFHNDHNGTPQVMTDENQNVVWQADYDPFGKATITVAAIENNLRFPGQYYDAESGLHYNHHRYYDPSTGRYTRSDPIGLKGGINTYGYVLANPIRYIDPLGLKTCVLVTRNSLGFGNHAALYGDNGSSGHPFIYDPAGSYAFSNGGGSGDLVSLPSTSIQDFTQFHEGFGDTTEVICKETTPEQEREFEQKAEDMGGGAPMMCSANVSSVIAGSPVFPNVSAGTLFPGNLASDASDDD